MASTGFTNGGSAANVDTSSAAWTNPTYALTSNNTRAYVNAAAFSSSDRLAVYNFGFSIPDGAVINEISVEIEGYAEDSTVAVYVYKAATTTGSGGGSLDGGGNVTIGSSSDALGYLTLTAPSITAAEVNSSTFGVGISQSGTTDTAQWAYIDCVRVSVDYTVGGSRVQFIGV